MAAPVAKKVEHKMELFGDVRVDNYYWLRDDSRSDPEVLSHLRKENEYADLIMSGTKQFEEELYAEIRGRVKEDDTSLAWRKGQYYYYEKSEQGEEHVRHCRRAVPDPASEASVHDVMADGPDAPPEHVILDENVIAKDHDYFKINFFEASPNHKLVLYAEDTKGNEHYTLKVIDADTRAAVEDPLVGPISDVQWVGDGAFIYTTMDDALRTDKVWLHKLGTQQSSDSCVYHEKDVKMFLYPESSESGRFVFVYSWYRSSSTIFFLDTLDIDMGLQVLSPREEGVFSQAGHRGDHFFVLRRTEACFNSELLVCPLNNPSQMTLLLPHRESVKMGKMKLFANHVAVCVREEGLPKIVVYHLPAVGQPLEKLDGGRSVDFADPVYEVYPIKSQFSSNVLRFSYNSLKTPSSVFDYDMDTGESVLKKVETVLGGFEAENYVSERKWAAASDGAQVPISIVYRKDLVKLDGSDPLLLHGYGAYGACIRTCFNASRLSLLDRGFIVAISHPRGGGEMGRQWHDDGKLMKKMNTMTDFIACAEYLIENNYCSKNKLCIQGGSGGGLLIGAVLNMRPDLFKAAVIRVPFVDVLTTTLDPTIPLTTAEWEEFGNPSERDFYFYIKSYSPVDNVKAQKYPHILITTGLQDSRVLYSEPAKFVAELREMKTDDNMLLFKCDFCAGHFKKSGRLEKLEEDALFHTFMLKALDMIPVIAQ